MPDFLLEVGCEEIPARMIGGAVRELRERVGALLERERLAPSGDVTSLDTPRRLAVLATGIPSAQPDLTEQVTGPSAQVAFKDGQATPAAHAFARKVGVDVSALERVTTPKGEYLGATVTRKGRPAAEILAETLPKEIATLYWPKNMYWRKRGELFVRPVRWLVAMLDAQVIPMEVFGIAAGMTSRGHRLLGEEIAPIARPSSYVDALREAKVLGAAEREHVIRKALDAATRTIPGARWREDKPLVATVVNLTEFPSVILGSFDAEFLALPEEVLVTVMRDHQKYFAMEDAGGKLLPHFLAVLNTAGDSDGLIRHGNERVLRARFNDARFFWQTDQKQNLRERVELLKHVTFQKDLGSYYDKTLRVQRLASWLAETIRQSGMPVRPGVVHKAALLAKTDLTTELVKEFTELQGVVGGLYARADGEPEAVWQAIYDHYKPVSMEDSIPRGQAGRIVALADKLDTLRGCFGVGLIPTGSRDPFALRRAAQGVVKILVEGRIEIPLLDVIGGDEALRAFFEDRVKFYFKDARNFRYDEVNAAMARGWSNLVDLESRLERLHGGRLERSGGPRNSAGARAGPAAHAGFRAAGGQLQAHPQYFGAGQILRRRGSGRIAAGTGAGERSLRRIPAHCRTADRIGDFAAAAQSRSVLRQGTGECAGC